ncbi:non-ribosomal peptide synthetase [Afifella marina]|uniref:Enterobactin synthetase component F n=3 Tax=Hyphomicrobiales TaxID=356 RepID=A0A1G5NTL9_AFIMA|nr:non-ribosomal peptide synthetase [Afifella marina]MBK1624142.1 hypothetical protein [Afifella marina DSM 2698]MBK1627699.1 hypothetical protein [Afifella marina]MBK5916423.1 hypothetical protein [Afifella marina]RAI20977.1 hypothetical protein CH311_08600 [Afifella marina DSM 2698]SCZ40696.1 enterobactin synthetase component F [Afifella marina DSM 2698]
MNRSIARSADPEEIGGSSQIVPLTEAASALWFAQALDPENPIFNTGQIVEIDGPLDVAAFARAITGLGEEADALRVRVLDHEHQALKGNGLHLEIIDCSNDPEPRRAAHTGIAADMDRPLDLAHDAPVCQRLYKLGTESFLWYQRLHHIVTDGFATQLATARVAELYNSAISGIPDGRPLSSLARALDTERAYRGSTQRDTDSSFWKETLAELDSVTGMKSGAARTARRYDHAEILLDETVCADLIALEQAHRLPWPDVLTAFSGAYYARHTTSDEALLGLAFMGRFGSRAARVPTMLMNILPLRLPVQEDVSLVEWLQDATIRMVQARRHGRYRQEWIRRDLGLSGAQHRLYGPLVNILPFDANPRLQGVKTALTPLGTGPVDDITISFRGDPRNRLALQIDTNPNLWGPGECETHAARLANFIREGLRASRLGQRLKGVATVLPSEHEWLVSTLNDTAHPVATGTLTGAIETAFTRFADKEALRFGATSLTYRELDERSGALAERLIDAGAGRDRLVAVALPRSIELVIALFAILRAGAAYLPLDATQPRARLERIMASACPVALLTDGRSDLGSVTTMPPSSWPRRRTGRSLPEVAPGDLAYVIYTSGSTGEPKGVAVEHGAIINRLEWMANAYGMAADDVVLQKTPMTFDVSVWEFFLSILNGGTLAVAPPETHKDPVALIDLVRSNGVTTMHFVPSMLMSFLAEPKSSGLKLRRVFVSGEELTADLRDCFHQHIVAELHNLYGPTEAAVDVSYWPAVANDSSAPVPIGRPVWNTRLYVLDRHLRPVPPGVEGHLHIAGRQLAREYLGRPDLTNKRFIPDPFHPGERMYVTGDLARLREDGAIVYLGRSDHQVKLRGLRIELGEIETALTAHPAVLHSVAVLREDEPNDPRIIAYATLRDAVGPEQLSDFLREQVPDYMLPSAILIVKELPLSTAGKLDRKALPAPPRKGGRGRPPETETERLVAMLFRRVLSLESEVSAHDNFFDLGGHSLLAVELMLHLREIAGRDPGLGTLFEHPTVARLAATLDAGDEDHGGLQPLLKLSDAAEDCPFVFLIHPAGGISWCYGSLARALAPCHQVWGLQAEALSPDMPAPRSLEAMAQRYAEHIAFLTGGCPVALGGWSVGGILAQTVAVRLQAIGMSVDFVVMLDSYPADCWRDEPDPGPGAELKALLAIGGHDPDALPDLPLTREAVTAFLTESGSPLGQLPAEALDGMVRVVGLNNRLVREHRHELFRGQILHFRATQTPGQRSLDPQTWRPYALNVTVHDVAAIHAHMTGTEALTEIVPVMSQWLDIFVPAKENRP